MSLIRGRLPTQRVELLGVVLLTLGMMGLLWWNRDSPAAATIVLTTVEALLPVALALVAAGLLASDPLLELLLTVPQPAPKTLLQRLVVVVVIGSLLAGGLLLMAKGWAVPLPQTGARLLLFWLSPALFWAGVTVWGAIWRGQMLDGVGLGLGLWAIAFFAIPLIEPWCRALGPSQPGCAVESAPLLGAPL